jgi:DUF4097 and DUF4098 domain-containing protein YvlB
MRRMNTLLALALLSATTETRVFPAGIKHIEITNGSGDVTFTGGPGDGVEVIAIEKDFDPKQCSLLFEQEKGTLRVSVKHEAASDGCQVSFKVTAPFATNLQTTTGSGDLKVRGITGAVSFTTGSGDTSIAGDPKTVDGRTGSGDVKLTYKKPPAEGSIDLRSGSGDALIELPEHTAFTVRFRAGSGTLRTSLQETKDAKFTIAAKSGSGDLRIERAN